MKKHLLKLFTVSIITLSGCSNSVASGNWKNITKDVSSGTTVTTTMVITESLDNFTGSMTSEIEGSETDKLKLPVKNINFSGYISGNILVIDQVEDFSNNYLRNSTLTVSEDGKVITIMPGRLMFNKE